MGRPRATDRSELSMTCMCTCGWVEFPELPQFATCSPSTPFWPTDTHTEPAWKCTRATKTPLSASAMVT